MMSRHTNAFHNYKYELESLETKYAWFEEKRISVYDLFPGGDILQPLRTDLDLPTYLIDQIATIRTWYEEMEGFGSQGEQ